MSTITINSTITTTMNITTTVRPLSEHSLRMSYKIGSIGCSYQYLVDVLGLPQDMDGDSKSQVNWYLGLTFKGNTYKISIYDWRQRKSFDKVKTWSIGGFNTDAVEAVKTILPNAEVTPFYL